jgi:SspJ family small acid-soluble spore protein
MDLFSRNNDPKARQKSGKDAEATQSALNEAEQALQGDPLKDDVEKKKRDQQER